ncbi:MAG: 5'-nucleotidase C-terminal domain-containing protein [Rhizobiaceae bacterium]|nr:5'-nucleotidase C-terminal domain-containing protein [Rhizobiaceae bacterium]
MKNLLKLATGAALATFMGLTSTAAQADYTLTILHLNDFHSRFLPINKYDSTCSSKDVAANKCFGGVARLKTKIDQRRKAISRAGGNVVVLSAGDMFQGSLFYTTYKGKATADFMNEMGFDAMVVGNHEFDDGPEGLAKFIDNTNFPTIGGNINADFEPVLKGKIKPYVIVEQGGQKIGIVGVTTTDTPEISSSGKNVSFTNIITYLQAIIPEMEAKGANKIIVLTHVGFSKDRQIAEQVKGVDVVVGGHSNTLLSNFAKRAEGTYPAIIKGIDGRDVPIVSAYAYSKYLGELNLTFNDAGEVTASGGKAHLLDSYVTEDADFAKKVAELNGPIEAVKAQVVGSASDVIIGDRKICRVQECSMGNMVSDAMLERVQNQGITIALANSGGLRASIDAGEITMGEVLTVLPFQNTLSTFQITGAGITAALENGVSQVEDVKGRFPQVAGLHFSWDKSVEPGKGRIQQVQVMEAGKWVDIDPAKTYGVVTNNFVRGGGDGYKVFSKEGKNAYDYGPGLEVVVSDYLAKHPDYKPYIDGRILERKTSTMATTEMKAEEKATKPVPKPMPKPVMKKEKMAKPAEAMKKKDAMAKTMKKDGMAKVMKKEEMAKPAEAMKKKDAMAKVMKKDAMAKTGEPMKKDAMKMDAMKPKMEGGYIIKAGDNLWNIARSHYGDATMWKKIQAANDNLNLNNLKIGDEIMLPK